MNQNKVRKVLSATTICRLLQTLYRTYFKYNDIGMEEAAAEEIEEKAVLSCGQGDKRWLSDIAVTRISRDMSHDTTYASPP